MFCGRNSRSPTSFHRKPPDPIVNGNHPNFIINLFPLSENSGEKYGHAFIQGLLLKYCKFRPYEVKSKLKPFSIVLYFTQWSSALEAVVKFWEALLADELSFVPKLRRNVVVESDRVELDSKLMPLFLAKLREVLNGAAVNRWEEKVQSVDKEFWAVDGLMRRRQHLKTFEELRKKREVLNDEKRMILKRIREFEAGIQCLINHIEGLVEKDRVLPLQLGNQIDWFRVYHLMIRECRRLDDGLPIYAYRSELLRHISSQQIMVLIGETGSGKSTQMVQFLSDSGIISDGSLICTQPRKIAVTSLAQRVKEESCGCYEDDAVTYYRSFSSLRHFNAKVIYMTDHCLLQHCMNDRKLRGVSCIIVDEAHERTLNTDLLLAMLKKLLPVRPDLRLIIMSATANAKQLSEYFFGCGMFSVVGRNFPVEVSYVPNFAEGTPQSPVVASGNIAPYVSDVVRFVTEIHKTGKEGTILVFLTSPMEVEWACEMLNAPDAVPLALHGKLSYEEQSHVFMEYPEKRKIIFATNVAETSLTIPGVKFVVDTGLAKESRFEPGSGMNVLRVCWISKSSANQRAGRAGRTEPGICYRLYSQDEFAMMASQQEPEIRRVHLGVAVLQVIALGIKNIFEFDFIDAPSSEAIDLATRNLVQLGAVSSKDGNFELTSLGESMVKLGIEPRLGKLILECCSVRLGREGIVLAAVMANASSMFCRVGNLADKFKADRLKVPFCHQDGDLFTLLSVYKEWENPPQGMSRNKWCWENCINAKAMQRCHDAICEWEYCLKSELQIIIPTYWSWTSDRVTQHDWNLKKSILASLAENVALYSGSDQLGYKVALSGQYVQLHPSCSLLMFNQKPDWVVFGDLVSTSSNFLACVTAIDRELLSTVTCPLFDITALGRQKLQVTTLSGYGKTLLKKFCGKHNHSLNGLVSRLRSICGDERISVEVVVDMDEIRLCTSSDIVEKVIHSVEDALNCEKRSLQNECMERCLYPGGPGMSPPVALFGSGAEIKHLELDKRCLTVDVFHPNVNAIDDKELTSSIESYASGICAVHKHTTHGPEVEERDKWGSITFLTPEAAEEASKLSNIKFDGSLVRLRLSRATFGVDRAFPFPAVKAYLSWPRRMSKGRGILKCEPRDADFMLLQLSNLRIGERYIRCEPDLKELGTIRLCGIDKDASEPEIFQALRSATDLRILNFFLIREKDAVEDPTCRASEEILFREISVFMPKGSPQIKFCRVQVLPPEPKNVCMKALITFDGRLHLEAAKALEQIDGKALPGFQSWQKIHCQRLFHTSVCCSSAVYSIIEQELRSKVARFRRNGRDVECTLDKNAYGSYRVKISAPATKIVAELRRDLEKLMKGKTITHASLTPAVLQLLFTRDGRALMKTIEHEKGVYVYFDRRSLSVRMCGPTSKIAKAEQEFIQRLLTIHSNKRAEIYLRGVGRPHDLMKEVVKRFGPDLQGLKTELPEADFTLNTRRHVIFVCGTKEVKQKVEDIVNKVALESGSYKEVTAVDGKVCPICLCELEDPYTLESCMHVFCSSCLLDQCESAIKSKDGFPICCTHEGCGVPIWLTDLKAILPSEKLDELFNASVQHFVNSNSGRYAFCPSPDCPSVYKVAGPDTIGEPFSCGACYAEICTKCHLEYHPYLSCEKYKEYKDDPDTSLKEWCSGKEEYVKKCPKCGHTIEKSEGCNHVECKCGNHLCWVCLESFGDSNECYDHLRAIHHGIS